MIVAFKQNNVVVSANVVGSIFNISLFFMFLFLFALESCLFMCVSEWVSGVCVRERDQWASRITHLTEVSSAGPSPGGFASLSANWPTRGTRPVRQKVSSNACFDIHRTVLWDGHPSHAKFEKYLLLQK